MDDNSNPYATAGAVIGGIVAGGVLAKAGRAFGKSIAKRNLRAELKKGLSSAKVRINELKGGFKQKGTAETLFTNPNLDVTSNIPEIVLNDPNESSAKPALSKSQKRGVDKSWVKRLKKRQKGK
jgi:hypothetical protein